jgi:hypothetical protein
MSEKGFLVLFKSEDVRTRNALTLPGFVGEGGRQGTTKSGGGGGRFFGQFLYPISTYTLIMFSDTNIPRWIPSHVDSPGF